MVKWVTLPNGVIHYNMSLSTTNILIVSVSFSYHSPIVLLLGKRKQYGNNTETIRNRTEDERRAILSDCGADCDKVSLLMIFQELIKVDFFR